MTKMTLRIGMTAAAAVALEEAVSEIEGAVSKVDDDGDIIVKAGVLIATIGEVDHGDAVDAPHEVAIYRSAARAFDRLANPGNHWLTDEWDRRGGEVDAMGRPE